MKIRLLAVITIAVLLSGCATTPRGLVGQQIGGLIGCGLGSIPGLIMKNAGVAALGCVGLGAFGAGVSQAFYEETDPQFLCGSDDRDRAGRRCLRNPNHYIYRRYPSQGRW